MRFAVLSDVHANADALKAVLDALPQVDGYVVCGDVVGYGPDPDAVCETVAELGGTVVLGNHDAALGDPSLSLSFNRNARKAIEWTREHISESSVDYLASLPLVAHVEGALVVHSSPYRPRAWDYLDDPFAAELGFRSADEALILHGHSHVPSVITRYPARLTFERVVGEGSVALSPDCRYMVNVGSVGQPRDGDLRASFAVVDFAEREVRFSRVPYDIRPLRERLARNGLPDFFAPFSSRGV